MKDEFSPKESAHSSLLALCVPIGIALIVAIFASIFSINANNTTLTIVVNIITELSFLFVAWWVCKKNDINFKSATKINVKPQKKFVWFALLLGVVCLLLFNPIISLWENLLNSLGYSVQDELPYSLTNVWGTLFALACVGFLPAICEETLFRGTVQNGTKSFGVKSILYAALLFSLMHQNLQQLPYTFILGIVSGILLYYSRSIWPCVIFHFTNNALVILLMALPDVSNVVFSWWMVTDSFKLSLLWQIIISIICVLLACVIIFFMIKFFNKAHDDSSTEKPTTKFFSQKIMLAPIILGVVLLLISTLSKFGVL